MEDGTGKEICCSTCYNQELYKKAPFLEGINILKLRYFRNQLKYYRATTFKDLQGYPICQSDCVEKIKRADLESG